ncbi:hypothetical protein OIU85_009322 [Salix viminalis]|uniref:Uncharacterized protein n=1 Tax=Salix viminalis TaxID=40686 RepID=A0A9Q0NZS5_SALVM|nr:hypothetical protein OIU85_009322 [Salix viminalis]
MALPNSISFPRRIPTRVLAISALFLYVNSFSFRFTSFSPNISFQGDAFSSNDVLQLTKNAKDVNLAGSAGRYGDGILSFFIAPLIRLSDPAGFKWCMGVCG